MSIIYKRNCNTCGKYYIGRGSKYCSHKCTASVIQKIRRITLLDGTWYPKIPDICHCNKCNGVVWGGKEFIKGHQSFRNTYRTGCHTSLEHIQCVINSRKGIKTSIKTRLKQSKSAKLVPKPYWFQKGDPKLIKHGKELQESYRINPELHPNRIMAKKGFISKQQMKLFELLKQIFIDAELEYPIRIKDGRIKFADIGIPSLNLDFEYDGIYWHNQTKDIQRQKEIEDVGWKIIRFVGKEQFNLEVIKLKLSKINILI